MLHTLWRRVSAAFPSLLLPVLFVPAGLAGQDRQAVVQVEENLRAEPNGVVVGVLNEGTRLAALREAGRWVEVVLEGWVWSRSLRASDRTGFDHLVSVPEGENLRAEPSGTILARMEEGALLEELDRRPGWIRVRRRAWVWGPSVSVSDAAAGEAAAASAGPDATPAAVYRAGERSPVLGSPDGDTLTVLLPGTELAVTGRQGNWARVRLEGWVWLPAGEAAAPEESEAPLELGVAAVRSAPEAYVGRIVTWELQFVSLERAEAVRTDFYEGEPFLLTRPSGDDTAARFVYVAIPPDRAGVAEGLTPLERITVVGRIRTGASTLTGAPILDLVELRRSD